MCICLSQRQTATHTNYYLHKLVYAHNGREKSQWQRDVERAQLTCNIVRCSLVVECSQIARSQIAAEPSRSRSQILRSHAFGSRWICKRECGSSTATSDGWIHMALALPAPPDTEHSGLCATLAPCTRMGGGVAKVKESAEQTALATSEQLEPGLGCSAAGIEWKSDYGL